MANFPHKSLTGSDLHEAFQFVQSGDPGAVGAGLYWLDTSVVPYILYRRASDNSEWVAIGVSGASGEVSGMDFIATGTTGAAHQVRYAGSTTGGAPTSGTWQTGDIVPDVNGKMFMCITAGTPGTWQSINGGGTLDIVFGGSGLTIAPGIKGDFRLDVDLQIIGWRMYADTVGTVTVDIWKATHATFPPTITNTIIGAGGTLPAISSSDHSQFVSLANWTTLVAKGSILRFNVSGIASITRATLALEVVRV